MSKVCICFLTKNYRFKNKLYYIPRNEPLSHGVFSQSFRISSHLLLDRPFQKIHSFISFTLDCFGPAQYRTNPVQIRAPETTLKARSAYKKIKQFRTRKKYIYSLEDYLFGEARVGSSVNPIFWTPKMATDGIRVKCTFAMELRGLMDDFLPFFYSRWSGRQMARNLLFLLLAENCRCSAPERRNGVRTRRNSVAFVLKNCTFPRLIRET